MDDAKKIKISNKFKYNDIFLFFFSKYIRSAKNKKINKSKI